MALAEYDGSHGNVWQALDAHAGTATTTGAVHAALLTPLAPGSAVPPPPRSGEGIPAGGHFFSTSANIGEA